MSLIFSVHVGIDGPEEVTANLEPLANGARVPLLKLGRAAVSFPFDDKGDRRRLRQDRLGYARHPGRGARPDGGGGMIATEPPADEKADHEEAEGRNREDLNEALGKYATREYRDSPRVRSGTRSAVVRRAPWGFLDGAA